MSTTTSTSNATSEDTDPSYHYFCQFPWTASILADPYLSTHPLSWNRTPWTGETFFGRTLNTLETIPHFCVLVPATTETTCSATLLAMVQLGPNVAGDTGMCHTGILSAILDEVMGTLVYIYNDNGKKPSVTASLSIEFCEDVDVPGVIVVRVWIESTEGRKLYVGAEVVGGDERDGGIRGQSTMVCARAKGLFITLREKS